MIYLIKPIKNIDILVVLPNQSSTEYKNYQNILQNFKQISWQGKYINIYTRRYWIAQNWQISILIGKNGKSTWLLGNFRGYGTSSSRKYPWYHYLHCGFFMRSFLNLDISSTHSKPPTGNLTTLTIHANYSHSNT